jgi:hypothetical protein
MGSSFFIGSKWTTADTNYPLRFIPDAIIRTTNVVLATMSFTRLDEMKDILLVCQNVPRSSLGRCQRILLRRG